MSGKHHTSSLLFFFARMALAGAFVLPAVRAGHAEGSVNLVRARVQVVQQSRNARTSVEIETSNHGSHRDYYPSRGYGSSGCGRGTDTGSRTDIIPRG